MVHRLGIELGTPSPKPITLPAKPPLLLCLIRHLLEMIPTGLLSVADSESESDEDQTPSHPNKFPVAIEEHHHKDCAYIRQKTRYKSPLRAAKAFHANFQVVMHKNNRGHMGQIEICHWLAWATQAKGDNSMYSTDTQRSQRSICSSGMPKMQPLHQGVILYILSYPSSQIKITHDAVFKEF